MPAELISRLRDQIGGPFPAFPVRAALLDAATLITRLTLHQQRVTLLVLNTLSDEQLVRSHLPADGGDEVEAVFTRVSQQIYVNGAQAFALAFIAGDLVPTTQWELCDELVIPECADDFLLDWSGPEVGVYSYVLAADSTGRALLARAPVIGRLTGAFRVDCDPETLEKLLPPTVVEALRLSALYCWPS